MIYCIHSATVGCSVAPAFPRGIDVFMGCLASLHQSGSGVMWGSL